MLETVYKTKQKRGYADKHFAVDDKSPTSELYFNIISIPETFTAGKNIIKLGANGIFLRRGGEIDLEIIDNNGNTVYNEYTGYRDRYGYYYLVVYVYDATAEGECTITLVGKASYDEQGNPIQIVGSEHEREYNVRWTTKKYIRPTDRNTSDIIFQKAPEVSISQVLTPYKFNFGTYTLNTRLQTQSLDNLTLFTSDNTGFDFDTNESVDIQTKDWIDNAYNYFQRSSTANTVQTNVRKQDKDILSGFIYSEYARYNTYVYDPLARFTKDMEGSIFAFADLDQGYSISNTWQYTPTMNSSLLQLVGSTGSLPTQLATYTPKIVRVLNNQYILLESPPKVTVVDSTSPVRSVERELYFKSITNVTASFNYPTSSLNEVRSINLSSSYMQFSFTQFTPIAGDVYRIKTYVKEAGRNTEYYQLNDEIVRSPELLIDTDKQNQAVYAKNKSDFFLYGEYTDQTIPVDYWRGFSVESGNIYQYSYTLSGSNPVTNYPQANSLQITSTATTTRGITSRYYQTYLPDEPYTLSFYCTLDSDCELSVYMSSTTLKDTAIGLQGPQAFIQSTNIGTQHSDVYSKFGKLIGKISNNSAATRVYDNVVFDFYPDSDGFGRPVFLLTTPNTTAKSAYISSVSITPLELVGYTPSILQFASNTPDSLNILQDDDASLTQSIDVKIEYFTSDGKQSEYTTYVPNLQINMVNEIPGFCAAESSIFNEHCPIYYEVADISTDGTTKQNTGLVTLDPRLYTSSYFWPTYSISDSTGYSWNIRSFQITGSTYNTLRFVVPTSSSVSSSWFRYDPFLPLYASPVPGNYDFTKMYSGSGTPVSYSAAPVDGLLVSTSPADRRFYEGTGAAIDKYELAASQSLMLYYSNSFDIQSDVAWLGKLETYLKKSRLYYPATQSNFPFGFSDNGGIYNVRFQLTQFPSAGKFTSFNGVVYPGDGSVITTDAGSQVANYTKTINNTRLKPETGAKLMVYIADVATPVTNSILVPGREGFFPPANNIVTIGNGYGTMPTIRFFDSGSGFVTDFYDIVLVQYGEKAQLVFDASGLEISLDNNGYYKIVNNSSQAFWGGIITNIEWCKIGNTTDPRFIKPSNFNDVFNTHISTVVVPPTPPTSSGGGYIKTT